MPSTSEMDIQFFSLTKVQGFLFDQGFHWYTFNIVSLPDL